VESEKNLLVSLIFLDEVVKSVTSGKAGGLKKVEPLKAVRL